jgi:CrcB protein
VASSVTAVGPAVELSQCRGQRSLGDPFREVSVTRADRARSGQHAADPLPIDPDVDPAEDPGQRRVTGVAPGRWPSFRADVVGCVFLGGCVGGWARYAVTTAWPTAAGRFPWATLTVNAAGSFILAVVVVVAAELVPSRYLRPLLGTGFCGALTTFSSVVVTADELFAHRHPATGTGYLLASIGAGLALGWSGLLAGRAAVARRRRRRPGGGTRRC